MLCLVQSRAFAAFGAMPAGLRSLTTTKKGKGTTRAGGK
jgi:hypothetical protein